jgi:hypothetical protein
MSSPNSSGDLPLIFDYNRFFNYYKNNAKTCKNPPRLKYYKDRVVHSNTTSKKYITIDGKNVYITVIPADPPQGRLVDALLFITPTLVNGELWDVHYHFGIMDEFTKEKRDLYNINAVYFHKTSQQFTDKKQTRCYFFTNQDITNVENIECLETKNSKISSSDKFPITGADFAIIREIIQRPFVEKRFGGKTRRRKPRRKQTRKR